MKYTVMNNAVRHILTVILSVCGALLPRIASAQSVPAAEDTVTTESYLLYYSHDDIDIDSTYLDNAQHINRIKRIFERSPRVDSITIYAYASPEGSPTRNQWLSERRAEAARDLLLSVAPNDSVISAKNIHLRPMGENWEGLDRELRANYHLMNRDRVLKIMEANVPTETKKWRLKKLDNGYTYRIIVQRHMPRLRVATWICVFVSTPELSLPEGEVIPEPAPELPDTLIDIVPVEPPVAEHDTIPVVGHDTIPLVDLIPAVTVKTPKSAIFALKTNLLYDALTALNAEIEVPIGKHFSIMFEDVFPWWAAGPYNHKYALQMWTMSVEPRWWFKRLGKRERLDGHFIAPYAMSGKYDFQRDKDLCYRGSGWSAGLTYGYALPLGKWINLEFSLSVGYLRANYLHYQPSIGYEHLIRDPKLSGRITYYGPTKAKVSLVLPINIKRSK